MSGNDYISAVLANRRRRFFEEMDQDPSFRSYMRGVTAHENGGDPGSVLEAATNRADMNGTTLRQQVHSGFFGPVNRGTVSSMGANRHYDDAFSRVQQGSNNIRLLTDQGMRNEHRPAEKIGIAPTQINGEWYSPMGARGVQWADGVRREAAETQKVVAPNYGPDGLNAAGGALEPLKLMTPTALASATGYMPPPQPTAVASYQPRPEQAGQNYFFGTGGVGSTTDAKQSPADPDGIPGNAFAQARIAPLQAYRMDGSFLDRIYGRRRNG